MKFYKAIYSFILIFALNAEASSIKIIPKVIYGTDDRMEVYESSDSLMRELSRSAVSKFSNDSLIPDGNSFIIKTKTLKEFQNVCSSEKYAEQNTAATCSGFLVSPDTIVTAGHCANTQNDCENNSWVFDYANIDEEKSDFKFNKDQIYHCTKILAREKNSDTTMNDFAVLKLDRAVTGRKPLAYRTQGKIPDDAVLTVIGNPMGLPIKITSGADLRDNKNPVYFTTNADTFGRNSGSAVINSKTGIVEGILVRGDTDFMQSPTDSSCRISVHHDQSQGRGEDVTRITNIKILFKNY